MIIPIPEETLREKKLNLKGSIELGHLLHELSCLPDFEAVKERLDMSQKRRDSLSPAEKPGDKKKAKDIESKKLREKLESMYKDFEKNFQDFLAKRLTSLRGISWNEAPDHLWLVFARWLRIQAEEIMDKEVSGGS